MSQSLVPVRVDGRFRIKERLGSGAYADVYRATNIFTQKSYAIKLELSLDGESSVEREYQILKQLEHSEGIPKAHWFGREASYEGLVLDLLGPSLHDLIRKHKRFHIHTIAHLAEQLLSRLQCIHDHGYIHADIKPQNILMGLGDNARTIFLIDFGIAKQYCDSTTGKHSPFVRTDRTTGTPAFTSINSHLGARLGRRDDLESLAYLLIFLSRGSLPWITSHSTKSSSILEWKQKTPIELLCSGLPRELAALLTYARALSFTEEPDYDYIRSMLAALHAETSDSSSVSHDLSLHEPVRLTSNTPPPPSHPDVGPHGPDNTTTPLPLVVRKAKMSSAARNAATPCAPPPRSRKRLSGVAQSSPVGQTPKRIRLAATTTPRS
ncbi:casein kinase I isoform delta-B-like protein [Boletus edulis]|nr:casein kinase I isoform delta-B-like protein [Boletus edulis]KAF8125274.1 casein kinase I isoform delta-B-like protein [Boletus edulis]